MVLVLALVDCSDSDTTLTVSKQITVELCVPSIYPGDTSTWDSNRIRYEAGMTCFLQLSVVLSSWLPVGQEESVVVHKDIRLDFLGTSERFHVINGAALGL